MEKRSRKKLRNHPSLQPGEQVLDTCWGMGRGALKLADMSGGFLRQSDSVMGSSGFAAELDRATPERDGMASRIAHNGMFVLTDRRLLWMEAKTALGNPKQINAEYPLGDVKDIVFDKPILSVHFADGSAAGIHTADKPQEFVAAWKTSRSG